MNVEARGVPRWRRAGAIVCFVLAAVLLPLGLLAGWANSTLYDSDAFSQRAVEILNSQAVRTALADKMTEQLAVSGNQQAVNFRPGFNLAIEAAINTDTFRSIFRSAVRQTHQAVLQGQKEAGLDLSDSVSIIAGTLQLPESAKPGQKDKQALGSSLGDVTKQLAAYHVWELNDLTAAAAGIGFLGGIAAGAGAIALAADRRRMVRRWGWVIVGDGLFIAALVVVAGWAAGRLVSSAELSAAVSGGISKGMADLRSVGLWVAGYGVVMAAAARAEGARRVTPAVVIASISGWAERRRARTRGRVALGAVAILAGLIVIANPDFFLKATVVGAGFWLAYFGATELVALVRARAPVAAEEGRPRSRSRIAWLAGVTAGLVALVSLGLVVTTRRAANRASEAGKPRCNGDALLCDLPLNLAVFPGTHNAMSSTLYPNWLFAEHIKTIGGQLNAGSRALLIDTHYGVPSSATFPGSKQPMVITDRAAELRAPTGEEIDIDPAIAQRAADLAKRFPRGAETSRDLYLCHNFCELGAIKFSDALGEVRTFLDSHPDDVVMAIIQDATTPADTAAAIESAGLGDRVYTLDPNKPLPTLGEMIRSGRTLLVFAEGGGDGGPPWYHKAYQGWFEETTYTFDEPGRMDCAPNRGQPGSPLFLMNHWLVASPPNPGRAAQVNNREFLEKRIRRCLVERGVLPTVVAVDFSERGELFPTARDLNKTLLDQVRKARRGGEPAATTTVPGAPRPPAVDPGAPASGPPVDLTTKVTTLTGGDAARFCQEAPPFLSVMNAWALANLFAQPSARGLTDLAFAPAAARVLGVMEGIAPQELAQLMALSRDRARTAVQTLRDLGMDDAGINAVADLTIAELSRPDNPDPVAVQETLLNRMRATVGADRLDPAGPAFTVAHPEPQRLFDLGDVSDDVARNSGYECVVGLG